MDRVSRSLGRLRRRARMVLQCQRVGWLLAGVLVVGLVVGLGDYVLRLPDGLRTLLWGVGVGVIAWVVVRRVFPAWRFRPTLTEIALRLEDSGDDSIRGLLASGLELEPRPDESELTQRLGERVRQLAAERFDAMSARRLLVTGRAWRSLACLAAGVAVLGGIWLMNAPLARVGVMRVATPWAEARWPARTVVADVTGVAVHPLGTALALRAAAGRRGSGGEGMTVEAKYRLVIADRAGPTRRVLLTGQPNAAPAGVLPAGMEPVLYEQLIEPAGVGGGGGGGGEARLEYWFETEDNRTPTASVLLVEPPAVVSASAVLTPPAYVGGKKGDGGEGEGGVGEGWGGEGGGELGAGDDERAVVGPVLAGTRLSLSIVLNKPVPVPVEAELGSWLGRTLGMVEPPADIEAAFSGRSWVLSWTLAESVRVPVVVTDGYGLTGLTSPVYRFDVIEDRSPSATVTEPAEDESVLASAVIEAAGEGRDDVGMAWSALRWQKAQPTDGSIGPGVEPVGEPVEFARIKAAAGPQRLDARETLDLSMLDLSPGDELRLTTLAKDTFVLGGVEHEPVESTPRRLAIIAETELIEQIRAELGSLRRGAIALDERQQRLAEAVTKGNASQEVRRDQASITDDLGRLGRVATKQSARVDRNRLDDEALRGLLDDATALLEGAGAGSSEASAEMASSPDQVMTEPEQQRVAQAQERVRRELEQLIGLLDRGEDGWMVRRSVQRLLDEQRRLAQRSGEVGVALAGKDAADLTAEELSELQQIAQRQRELARRAGEMLDELAERSRQMERVDPGQSQAMSDAARRGREGRVPESLDEAARQIQQNRTSSAGGLQQEAIKAMERMLEDLDKADAKRDEALRRVLAGLIASLRTLVRAQEDEIASLGRGGVRAGLDAGMARLHQNTLGVAGRAEINEPEMGVLRDLIDSAATAQSQAVLKLRAEPIDGERVRSLEELSLARLRDAVGEAERLKKQAEAGDQQRKRQELRRAYRDALQEQVALRGEAEPYVGMKITRRQRVVVRSIGERQDTLRGRLDTLRQDTKELGDAAVFAFAHDRLDGLMGGAAGALRRGRVDDAVLRRQGSAVRTLQGIVEALKDGEPPKDDFRDQDGGKGGGAGGGGKGEGGPLIPSLAQLKLLRSLQQEAADLTRDINDEPSPDPARLEELALLQRQITEHSRELVRELTQPPAGKMPVEDTPR